MEALVPWLLYWHENLARMQATMPVSAQNMPAPAQITPSPDQIMRAPAQIMPSSAQITPSPAQNMRAPAQVMPSPDQIMPYLAHIMPYLAQIMPSPSQIMPGPAQIMPYPVRIMSYPAQIMPSPVQEFSTMEAVTCESGSSMAAEDNRASKRQKINNNPPSGDIDVGINRVLTSPEPQFRSPTLADILNPRYLELVEASDAVRRPDESGKNKSQHRLLVNSGKAESGRNCFQDVVNGENCPSTISNAANTMLKSVVCPQVASSQMGTISTAIIEPKVTNTPVKKLLVLDVNGVLGKILKNERSICKRPYLVDFLHFCFKTFHVGIWSSRSKTALHGVVDHLLGNLKERLLFLWDGSKCVKGTKYLQRIWDTPIGSWVKGTFNESNTLLIDDSPQKAKLNPMYTGIFPDTFIHPKYQRKKDNFLAPGGPLQTYLEGWAAADDGRAYVQQHPFGRGAIAERRLLQQT